MTQTRCEVRRAVLFGRGQQGAAAWSLPGLPASQLHGLWGKAVCPPSPRGGRGGPVVVRTGPACLFGLVPPLCTEHSQQQTLETVN